MMYGLDDVLPDVTPEIRYTMPEFEGVDDPDAIRWRAGWDSCMSTGVPVGIEMQCYPVTRKTPRAAWIDPYAFRELVEWTEVGTTHSWNLSDPSMHKLVYDRSIAGWAKPTQAEALRSLGARLTRWSARTRYDIDRLNAACDVAGALIRDHLREGLQVSTLKIKMEEP